MKVERFSFRDLSDGTPAHAAAARIFVPDKNKIKEEPDLPPPPPSFSEEELKTAERDSYQKGFLAGEQEGRRQAESEQAAVNQQLMEAMEKSLSSVLPVWADYRRTVAQLQQEMPQVALAIARKVAGKALEDHAQGVIEDMAVRCLHTMTGEPQLTITVHESAGDTLARKLEELAERVPGAPDVVILRDPAMPRSDCRIEWRHGAMERNSEQLWQQVGHAIEGMTETAQRDADQHIDALQSSLGIPEESPATGQEPSAAPKDDNSPA